MFVRRCSLVVVAVVAFVVDVARPPRTAAAQTRTIAPVCIACKKAAGLRFNYRDRDLERVDGANITVWRPYEPATGEVRGFALGLGATGAASISGIAVAPVGIVAAQRFVGIGIAGLGYGVGDSAGARGILVAGLGGGIGGGFTGISVAGLGNGIGGDVTGITVAGLGNGIGGNVTGILVAGLGAGVAGTMKGIAVAGLGLGGGSVEGVFVAGLGAGLGGRARGITVAGLGAGVGGAIEGLLVAGLGAGAGERVRGIAVAGLGIGSPAIEGLVVTPIVRTVNARGAVVALSFKAHDKDAEANVEGFFVAPVNDIRGMQRGISIGVVNYARALKGAQIGVVNIVTDGRGPRILPLVNWR
jgi:hypothetical protein